MLRELREKRSLVARMLPFIDIPPLQYAAPVIVGVGVAVLFFYLQKDLGPALVFACVFLTLYSIARNRVSLAVAGLTALLGGFLAGYFLGTPKTVHDRVAMWLSPWSNMVRGGDQVAHSLWAMASGGALGTGPGLGESGVIPAGYTDLIVSVLGEDWGFLGIAVGLSDLRAADLARAAHRAARAHRLRVLPRAGPDSAGERRTAADLERHSRISSRSPAWPRRSSATGAPPCWPTSPSPGSCCAGTRASDRTRRTAPFHAGLRWVEIVLAALLLTRRRQSGLRSDRRGRRHRGAGNAGAAGRWRPPLRLQSSPDRRRAHTAARHHLRPHGPAAGHQQLGRTRAASRPIQRRSASISIRPAIAPIRAAIRWRADIPSARRCPHARQLERAEQFAASSATTPFVCRAMTTARRVVEVRTPRASRSTPFATITANCCRCCGIAGSRIILAVKRIRDRERNVHLSISAALQVKAAQILNAHLAGAASGPRRARRDGPGDRRSAGFRQCAFARSVAGEAGAGRSRGAAARSRALRLYPPGSTFKVVTAIAALRLDPALANQQYKCIRLPDGRTGNYVGNSKRPIRDDEEDKNPHGTLDMHRAIVVSCNAYFAQLGTYKVGPEQLLDTAKLIGISVANPPTVKNLSRRCRRFLTARGRWWCRRSRWRAWPAAIAAGGKLPQGRWVTDDSNTRTQAPQQLLPANAGGLLAKDMRGVVTNGTGNRLAAITARNRRQNRHGGAGHRAVACLVHRVRAVRRERRAHRVRHTGREWTLRRNGGGADGGRSRDGGGAVTFDPMRLLRRIEKTLDDRLRSIFVRRPRGAGLARGQSSSIAMRSNRSPVAPRPENAATGCFRST